MQNQTVEKLSGLARLIEDSIANLKQGGFEISQSSLKYSEKISEFERELENLRRANQVLGSENAKYQKTIDSQEQEIARGSNQGNSDLDLERITNALQKGLELIRAIGNSDTIA